MMKKICSYVMIIIFLSIFTSCSKEKEGVSINKTPTPVPDLPPYIIQIDGIWYSTTPATEELPRYSLIDKNIDFSIAGKIETYSGDVYTLPSSDNQTNYDKYLNLEYGYINDHLYLSYREYIPLGKKKK